MSRESSIQSKPLMEEGGQCIPKDFEEEVCIDEAEYHYDPINQVCSPDPVIQVEYKETKKGIEKIVKLDEQKILANRAQNFRAEPKKEAQKKVEDEEEIIVVEMELHTHGVSPELISVLIEQHEEVVAQPELLTLQTWDLSGHIYYHSPVSERQVSSQEVRRSRLSDEPEDFGCSESERVLSESSLQPLLGAAILSGEKGIYPLLAERIEADRAGGREIDFVFLAVQRQLASESTGESQTIRDKEPVERENFKTDLSTPGFAQAHSQAYFVFSTSEMSPSLNTLLPLPHDQGAFLTFHFNSLPVADRNYSVIVVLFPSLVSPWEEGGIGKMKFEGNGTRATHTKVEPGSDSQSSKDSKHSGGHGNGRDPNQRDQNRERNEGMFTL